MRDFGRLKSVPHVNVLVLRVVRNDRRATNVLNERTDVGTMFRWNGGVLLRRPKWM